MTLYVVNSVGDFCLFAPPGPGSEIGSTEVSYPDTFVERPLH
jgi:hypothetical protein